MYYKYMILIVLIPAIYWLLIETDYLRVNLNASPVKPQRELSLFDATVNNLLGQLDGDIDTWYWNLKNAHNKLYNERCERQYRVTKRVEFGEYSELSDKDLLLTELAYESLIPSEQIYGDNNNENYHLEPADIKGTMARVAGLSTKEITFNKYNLVR